MDRKLIVNADDYGRSPGISRGILQAHREGIVTSTTVMINQPEAEMQLLEARACSKLGIGLHLVFTAGRPLLPPTDIPSLVDKDGFFLDHHTLWARASSVSSAQLLSELTAQVERLVALVGQFPDHLDCHHFVYLFPPFFQVYLDLADHFSLPIRLPFAPTTDFSQAADILPFLEGFPHDLVRGMIVTNSALLRARGLAHPDCFIGTFYGQEAMTLDYLLHLIRTLPTGTSELMCHPGYDDPVLAPSTYRHEREIELALLTHPAVHRYIDEAGIELVTFDALT